METTFPPSSPATRQLRASLSKSQIRRAVLASVIGNGLEWFDFLIYGYFAKIIAHVFFPVGNTALSTTLTLGTFAVGFIVRPLGGICDWRLCGSRRAPQTLSMLILLMAASTLLMGLTPGYSTHRDCRAVAGAARARAAGFVGGRRVRDGRRDAHRIRAARQEDVLRQLPDDVAGGGAGVVVGVRLFADHESRPGVA